MHGSASGGREGAPSRPTGAARRAERVRVAGAALLAAAGAASAAWFAAGAPFGAGARRVAQAPADLAPRAIAAAPTAEDAARSAALAAVRARLPPPIEGLPNLFELRVYRFGPADEIAVCGLVLGRDGTTAEPFVARVLLPAAAAGAALPPPAPPRPGEGTVRVRLRGHLPLVVLEEGAGLWRSGRAERRYCRDAGTPEEPPRTMAGRTRPDQGAIATGSEATAWAGPPVASEGGAGWMAPESVVLRSPANIRSGPSGSHPVITTAPRGTVRLVQGHAAGGWVRIGGDGGPEGWVHSSLLEAGRVR